MIFLLVLYNTVKFIYWDHGVIIAKQIIYIGSISHPTQYFILLGAPGWLSQLSIQLWVSAQGMISQFTSSSPTSGSVLRL